MHYRSTREPAVENKAGNIYYVRLKTPLGPMYKLGFTSMRSVQERLAFQGGGDERLVDGVLCFVASPNALAIEQKLHRHFIRAAVFPLAELEMPLAGNGQSEVYVEDILGIDPEYTPAQGQRMRESVMRMRMIRTGSSPAEVVQAVERKRQGQQDVEHVVAMARVWPITWLVLAWQKLGDFLLKSDHDKSQAAEIRELLQWVRRSSGVSDRNLAACDRQADPHRRADDVF